MIPNSHRWVEQMKLDNACKWDLYITQEMLALILTYGLVQFPAELPKWLCFGLSVCVPSKFMGGKPNSL